MNRPVTMSEKDYLMKVMSVRMNIPLKTVEAVVNHQFTSMNKSFQTDNIYSIEMSGFGKFTFNHKKAKRKMDKNLSKELYFSSKLENPDLSDKEKTSLTLKLENTRKWMQGVKNKIDICPKLQNTLISQ